VSLLAPYAKGKIAAYHAQISDDDQTIKLVAAAMKSKRSSRVDSIVLMTRLAAAQTDKIRIAGLLAQTILVEKPLQTGHARAIRVTARTSKSSALVAGLIGLIVAVLGVLFLDARARRVANDSVAPS
jgi:DNA-binding transcriptional regulator YbjK